MSQENKNQENKDQQKAKQANDALVNQQKEKRRKRAQQYQKEALQNKKRWMPFVRFLKKNGLKFKAARCGKVRIQYFRTDELEKVIQQKKDIIEKDSILKESKHLWQKQVIYFARPQNLPKLKYPQQLEKSEGNSKSKFASFKFDSAEPKTWLFPAILFGIIAVVLFPLWPYTLKYAIFIIALYLVIAIVGLIVLRLICYLFFAIFGVSFWVLPNFFADCTVMESFKPAYSVLRWQSGIFSTVGRLVAVFIFGYYAYHLYTDSSWVYENIQITKTSFQDLHDWGVSKIKGQKNFSQSALTNLQHIMNQTADAHPSQSNGVSTQSQAEPQVQAQIIDSAFNQIQLQQILQNGVQEQMANAQTEKVETQQL